MIVPRQSVGLGWLILGFKQLLFGRLLTGCPFSFFLCDFTPLLTLFPFHDLLRVLFFFIHNNLISLR